MAPRRRCDDDAPAIHVLGGRTATRRAAAGSARDRCGTVREQPGLHHVGLWSDDIAGETSELVAAGWELRFAQRDPADGYGVFTYVQPPSGLLVELVSTSVQPMFERWFAGGPLA